MPSFQSIAFALLALSSTALAKDMVIQVGNGGLVFAPDNVQAAIGDNLIFEFYAKNHTLTQSTFAKPCERLNNATTGAVGLDSDFMPVAAGATVVPTVTVTVNATTPLWFYCKQGIHCVSGMVLAVNAPATGNTFEKYLANAKAGASAASTAPVAVGGSGNLETGTTAAAAAASGTAVSGGTSSGTAAIDQSSALAISLHATLLTVVALVSLALL